jgi:hypothetical protein
MRDELSAQTQSTFYVYYVCLKYKPVTDKVVKTVIFVFFEGLRFIQILNLCKNEIYSGKRL